MQTHYLTTPEIMDKSSNQHVFHHSKDVTPDRCVDDHDDHSNLQKHRHTVSCQHNKYPANSLRTAQRGLEHLWAINSIHTLRAVLRRLHLQLI